LRKLVSPTRFLKKSTCGFPQRYDLQKNTTPDSATSSTGSFQQNWKDAFAQAGIEYFFTLIDDAVARIMKTEGGMLWALKKL